MEFSIKDQLQDCRKKIEAMETENHEQEIITMFKYLNIPLEAKYAPNRLTAEKAINSGYIYRDRLGYRFKYRLPDITTEELRELKELYSDAKKAQEKNSALKKKQRIRPTVIRALHPNAFS